MPVLRLAPAALAASITVTGPCSCASSRIATETPAGRSAGCVHARSCARAAASGAAAPEEKLVCPDCARRSTKREVGKLDSRSGAIRPSARHAPSNSAISDRISGVMRNFARSRAVIHSPIRFHPNGIRHTGLHFSIHPIWMVEGKSHSGRPARWPEPRGPHRGWGGSRSAGACGGSGL